MNVNKSIAEFNLVHSPMYEKSDRKICINLNNVEAWTEIVTDVLRIFTTNRDYLVTCNKETFEFNYFSWANTFKKF